MKTTVDKQGNSIYIHRISGNSGFITSAIKYEVNGDYDKAIADCDEAIKLAPKFAWAYVQRGFVYHQKGNYDRAIADCDEAIRLNPDAKDAYYNRGIAYHRKGDNERALADLNKAVAIDPTTPTRCNI